jgi:deoxyribonuclease-4
LAFTDFVFGTVGTPRSTPKKPGGTIGTIRHLATLELLAFEIGWVRSVRVSEKTCAAIKETADELGMHLSVHGYRFSSWLLLRSTSRGCLAPCNPEAAGLR